MGSPSRKAASLDRGDSTPRRRAASAASPMPDLGRASHPSTSPSPGSGLSKGVALREGETKAEQPRRLVANVTVELAKPLNATWDEAGARLRDLRDVSHRLLNAAVSSVVIANAKGEGGDKAAAQAARDGVKEQLVRERESARKAYDKKPTDTLERRAVLALPSVIEDFTAAKAKQAATDYLRKHAWRGDKSLPSFKHGAPIFFRDGSTSWRLRREDARSIVLALKLTPGRSDMTEFAIGIDGGGAWAHVRRMLDGIADGVAISGVKLGDCKVVYLEKKRKWLAKLCYSWDAPPLPGLDVNRLMAVHRGIRAFLTFATSDGLLGVIGEGSDVVAVKAQWAGRRAQLRGHKREIGKGAKGHGYKRRYATYRTLDDIERNWSKTYCQQRAAHVVRVALQRGCWTVVMEDYSAKELADEVETGGGDHVARMIRQFPFALLKTCVVWACAKAGIRVIAVPSQYESITCPKCGNIDAGQDDGRGTFLCAKCSTKRNVDGVAAWNMLNSAGCSDGFKNADAAIRKLLDPK